MQELQMYKEYTGQEIIDWISGNQKSDIAKELTRKYYQIDKDWFEVKCNINPTRKYIIKNYITFWYDNSWKDSYSHHTYKIERAPIIQPRRSSLRKRGLQNEMSKM